MKPFNLKEALNGAELRTRDGGHLVEDFTRVESSGIVLYRALIDDQYFLFHEDGKFFSYLGDQDYKISNDPYDLFMKEVYSK